MQPEGTVFRNSFDAKMSNPCPTGPALRAGLDICCIQCGAHTEGLVYANTPISSHESGPLVISQFMELQLSR